MSVNMTVTKMPVVVTIGDRAVDIFVSRSMGGDLDVQMQHEETSDDDLRAIQSNPQEALKQINAALKAAGHPVPDNSDIVDGPNVPLKQNDIRLSPGFLQTLVVCARSIGHGVDYVEVQDFLQQIFTQAGIPIPTNAQLEPFPIDEATDKVRPFTEEELAKQI